MNAMNNDLKQALDDVSASSAGGAPFLIAYALTFLITGILSFFLTREISAMIALFQGGIALPLALWLEGKMRSRPMDANNPLRSLSAQLAISQALALPALIVVYTLNPSAIPVVMAGLGGVHFMPYAWLHRTRLYAILGGAIAIGAFVLQLILGTQAFSIILLYIAVVYGVMAVLVYKHAKKLVAEAWSPHVR